jgi:uncharacterized caspase-like protein
MGFETIVGLDVDRDGMEDTAIRFSRAADVAMFYYAGHAMQHGGINYLIPVDARLRDGADLRRIIRVDEIVADLQQAKNLRILILDAHPDNPLPRNSNPDNPLPRNSNTRWAAPGLRHCSAALARSTAGGG